MTGLPRSRLRDALERLTADLAFERITEQVPAIEELKAREPHSLQLLREAVPGKLETYRYTCFQYAFGLVSPPPDIVGICTLYPKIYPNSEYVQFLIRGQLRAMEPGQQMTGDIVIYFDGETPRHAGVFDGDAVISKWGTAHLWRHRLEEVPANYGDRFRFYRLPPAYDAEDAFRQFALEQLEAKTQSDQRTLPTESL
ncbi:MAG: hypothetical protein JWO05_3940 [Gemmatimonadetes bacterium]|nr:hypothetical protein [Gemmatimonadota bacterium]